MGVKEVKLKELLLVFRNGACIKQFEGAEGLPITRIETISDATINPLKVGYANIFDDKYQDYYLQEGDILLSHINSVTHLGKCAIYTNPIDKLIHGMNLLMLRANKDLILPKYLYYVLNSKQFKVQLPKITKKSVNQASMTVTDIGNLKLLIEEDLAQQQKVVEILDKADEIRAKKKLANDKLDEFLKSTFISMFGDPVRNEKNLPIKEIVDISTLVSSGSTPLGGSSVYQTEGVLFIRSQNVLMNKFDFSDIAYISDEIYDSMTRTQVKKNDVLLNITGASIGRIHSYMFDDKANVNQHVCIIRPILDEILPVYLEFCIGNSNYQYEILRKNAGATRQAFNYDQIKKFKIPLPKIEEQNKFAKIVEKVEAQKQKNEFVIEQMNNLFNSLSQRAFKGEI